MAEQAPPRTVRALMAERGIYRNSEVVKRSKGRLNKTDVSLIINGFRSSPTKMAAFAKVLGFSIDEIVAAQSEVSK